MILRAILRSLLYSLLVLASDCVYTVAGKNLPPISPSPPSSPPSIEQTVGDFAFTLEGGKMITSNFQGSQLNKDILGSWKERGYIRDQKYVEGGKFSGAADYNLTLSGTQYGESSIFLQIVSGLTIMVLPYSVDQKYDLQFTVQDVKTGATYSATVQETEKTYVELLLLFALPWGMRGHNEAMQRMGDYLYEKLRSQGAFEPSTAPAVGAP